MSSQACNSATEIALEESKLARGAFLIANAIDSAGSTEEIQILKAELAALTAKAEAKGATLASTPASRDEDFTSRGRLLKLAPTPEQANDNTLEGDLTAAFPNRSIRKMLHLALANGPLELEYQQLEAKITPHITDKEAQKAVAGIFRLATKEGANPNDPTSWSQRLQKIADLLYKSHEPVEPQTNRETVEEQTLNNELDWFQGETPENLVNFSLPTS